MSINTFKQNHRNSVHTGLPRTYSYQAPKVTESQRVAFDNHGHPVIIMERQVHNVTFGMLVKMSTKLQTHESVTNFDELLIFTKNNLLGNDKILKGQWNSTEDQILLEFHQNQKVVNWAM